MQIIKLNRALAIDALFRTGHNDEVAKIVERSSFWRRGDFTVFNFSNHPIPVMCVAS
jgi:hypothetical protein